MTLGSATCTPTTINPGEVASVTLAVSKPPVNPDPAIPIEAGDLFTVTPPTMFNAGVFVTGSDVTTSGTVVVTLYNASSAAITPVATNWKVRWMDLTP